MSNKKSYKIATVNYHEYKSGAAFIARTLFQGFRNQGHDSKYIVQYKTSDEADVYGLSDDIIQGRLSLRFRQLLGQIPGSNNTLLQKIVRKAIRAAIDPKEAINYITGRENTHYKTPYAKLIQEENPFDIIHLHNLHGGYFGIDYLPALTSRFPVVLTLDDNWLLTGHCAYFIDCNRWKTGCGSCPDLKRYPSIKRDNSRNNWLHKKDIYTKCRFYVVGGSRWAVDQAKESIMAPSIKLPTSIDTGIDLSTFSSGNQVTSRANLNIHQNQKVVLFVANALSHNPYKDYDTFIKTFECVGEKWKGDAPVLFLGLGGDEPIRTKSGNAELLIVGKITDPKTVASYYQSSDIYLHTARADTFPTTILEAMACGLPIVATNVGGIPEQVIEDVTGYLANFRDYGDHAALVLDLLINDGKSKKMGIQAARIAKQKYDKSTMVSNYLDYFEEVLDDWKAYGN